MYGDELKRACVENSFAIESYELGPASDVRAEASVTTLERKHIQVELSDAGFKIVGARPATYDTLDSLLLNNSPLAMIRTNERLEAKLREYITSQGEADEGQQ